MELTDHVLNFGLYFYKSSFFVMRNLLLFMRLFAFESRSTLGVCVCITTPITLVIAYCHSILPLSELSTLRPRTQTKLITGSKPLDFLIMSITQVVVGLSLGVGAIDKIYRQ